MSGACRPIERPRSVNGPSAVPPGPLRGAPMLASGDVLTVGFRTRALPRMTGRRCRGRFAARGMIQGWRTPRGRAMRARSSTRFGAASGRPSRSSTRPSPRSRRAISTPSRFVDADRARRAAARRRLQALRRRPHRDQGARTGSGLAPDRGVARLPRPGRDAHHGPRRAPARPGRGGPRRPDDRERVRRAERQRHQAQRRHAQPVASRPHRGRLVRRFRRPPSPVDSSRWPPAATAAARSGSPPATSACSG